MFSKFKVPQSLIDAVSNIVETAPVKIPTSTGTKVLGGSYGNSAKAHQDQTKKDIDKLKGPKDKELKEGGDCVTEPEAKNIAKKEVKGHEKKMHQNESFAARLIQNAKLAEEVEHIIQEVLKKDATAGDWIHDFIHSDNPKFAGKSKAERKKMALGAYYAKQNEGYEGSADDKQDDKEEAKKAGMTLAQWEKSAKDKKEDKEEAKEKGKKEKGEKEVKEELKGNQYKLDKNKNNKLDSDDFKKLRKEESEGLDEAKETTNDADANRVTTDTLNGREDGGKSNSFKSFKLKLKTDGEMKAPPLEGQEDSTPIKSIKARAAAIELKKDEVVGAVRKEEVELDEETPAKNTDIADKSYLKTMGKKPTIKSDLKNFKSFLTGKKETNEEVEQIDELSKSTLGSYVKKAAKSNVKLGGEKTGLDMAGHEMGHERYKDEIDKNKAKIKTRDKGIYRAVKQLSTEEVEFDEVLDEAVSRKDFQMVADLIKTHDDHDKRKMLAQHHAEIFHRQNPRFDREKFMKAANVNESKTLSPGQDDAPFDPPYSNVPKNVTDKSGAVHTPMSRAKDLARQAFKKIKKETMMGKISN